MKKLFPVIAIATIMASCSSDETIDVVAKVPITFGNAFVENATRAANPIDDTWTNSNLKAFKVYGTVTGNGNTVNIYDGDEVTGTVGTSNWDCERTQYWVPGSNYQFISLVDADKSIDVTVAGNTETINNLVETDDNGMPTSITYDVRTQGDLLLATASRDLLNTNETGAVNFSFNHLLAKAQFTFINNFAELTDVKLEVKEIKITNARKDAKYTYNSTSGTWDEMKSNDPTTEVSFGDTEQISCGGDTGTCGNVGLLIPGEYTLNISFTVYHNKGGEPSSLTASAEINLMKGHSYNFIAELNSENVQGVIPISFKITEDTDWENDDDENVDY